MKSNEDSKRIEVILDAVMKVARGDFSQEVILSDNNDDLDALAMGVNMMIDDLRINFNIEEQNKKIIAINEELTIAKEKALESERLKSAFLANMSHEIRTPLNAIIGFTTILMHKENLSEKGRKYLSFVENAGNHLLELINDIIDLSIIDSNQLKIEKDYYNLGDLMKQVYEMICQDRRLLAKPDLRLVFNLNHEMKNCILETDQVRFRQIFINLITNAIKFTEKGSVEVGCNLKSKQEGDELTIYVKDTGKGIPVEMQEVIFERFRQVQGKDAHEGAGLGLSITKALVDNLGGSIWMNSEQGSGTVFYINFPCTIESSPVNVQSGDGAGTGDTPEQR